MPALKADAVWKETAKALLAAVATYTVTYFAQIQNKVDKADFQALSAKVDQIGTQMTQSKAQLDMIAQSVEVRTKGQVAQGGKP